MADIIKPSAFNEPFTLYLNDAGKPVQRSLREMTAAEVLLAMEWQTAEANKLQAEVEPWLKMSELIDAGRMDEVPDLHPDEFRIAGERCNEAAEASLRRRRLLRLIQVAMPQWQARNAVGLRDALRRWWPGRHAA